MSPDGVAVLATRGKDVYDYYGFPIQVHPAPYSCVDSIEAAIALIGSRASQIADYSNGASSLSQACKNLNFIPARSENAWCDLTGGEDAIHKALRKSYRSLVNWGRRNIHLSYINAENPDREQFKTYQDFHAQIAGRSTRPQATWDAMFDWIAKGGGELSLGRLENGDLVSGTMVVDGKSISFYASGVYDRDRFEKPMGHWPVYDSIVRSMGRGMKLYDLGDVPAQNNSTTKQYNIGQFKSGFATHVLSQIMWRSRHWN